jgi:apolipoprotein D and lipocalin family protein
MNLNKTIAVLITVAAALFAVNNLQNKGDHLPWCLYPYKYIPSMQVTTKSIDVPSYMGTWYEMVSKNGAFEQDCKCAKAVYGFDTEGKFVTVDNTCIAKTGGTIEAKGKAYPKNDANSKLEVYFNPAAGGAYWVLAIDENYQHVLVGEPCRRMMWILSRTKTLDQNIIDGYLKIAREQGYDTHDMKYRDPSC